MPSMWPIQVLLFGTFGDFFSMNIFYPLLVKSMNVNPADTEAHCSLNVLNKCIKKLSRYLG